MVADAVAVAAGLLIVQGSKAWFIDRMVLLFEHMKSSEPEYAELGLLPALARTASARPPTPAAGRARSAWPGRP